MTRSTLRIILALAAATVGCASPSGPTNESPSAPSASEMQSLADQFAKTAVNGFGSTTSKIHSIAAISGPASATASPAQTVTVQVFQPWSVRTNCAGGGYVSSVGHVSGSISVSDTLGAFGNISLTGTDSIIGWGCAGNWIVNGDPYLSEIGTLKITGNNISADFRQSGGFVATQNGARAGCQVSVHVTWDNSLGGRVQGSVTCNPGGTASVNQTF